MKLAGKIILVAGASSGMGRQTALRAGAEGATVIAAARRLEDCEAVARTCGGASIALSIDGTDPESVAAGFAKITHRFGKLDGAFNNLGATLGTARVHEIPTEQWQASLAVNLTAPFLLMKAEIPLLIAAGGGVIVNNSSTAGVRGTHSMADYSAAKWGLIGLGQSAALEYGAENIRINTIAPGIIRTEKMQGFEAAMPDLFDGLRAKIPGNRFGDMQDIATTVCWLLSDEARFINGATLRVDGGSSA
ncbi:SDR family NAD(P)-dependent oxidoreductase [Polymorphobacter sp.]|uniref:SDR family NAD(P)-dependent oxidoreductase n=1 Tax=Polymorphobacter sp. TaxID=1909290 RepID=UPI003F71AE4C